MEPTALGRYLRESREARELTLDDAVQALRIRLHILQSFERGEFDVADTPVRVRGMLRNYAQFLGLEAERVLQYYEASQDERYQRRKRRRKSEPEPVAPRRITDTPPALPAVKINSSRDWGAALRNISMLIVSVLALVVIAFVIQQIMSRTELVSDGGAEVALVGNGTPTATYTASWTPLALLPTSQATISTVGITGIRVEVRITQRTWMRVQVDGAETFAGVKEPGQQVVYEGSERVVLVIANAAGVEILYNGTQLEPYGVRGQQVQLEFSAAGVQAVGAGVQPTLTETIPPVPTLSAAATATAAVVGSGAPIGSTDPQAQGTILPTPTPLFTQVALPTPTPLFPQQEMTATVDGSGSAQQLTATPQSAEAGAVLPSLETPANPTPTKTG
jgi:hypothetical protein